MLKITAEFYKRLKEVFDYSKAVEEIDEITAIEEPGAICYIIHTSLGSPTRDCDNCEAYKILIANMDYFCKYINIDIKAYMKHELFCMVLEGIMNFRDNATFGWTRPPSIYCDKIVWSKSRHKAMQHWFREFWVWFEKNVETEKELK